MTHAMGVRATAFAASAAMLALAATAALTMTFRLRVDEIFPPPAIPVITERPPPPAPRPTTRPTPPIATISDPFEAPFAPPAPFPPEPTALPSLIGVPEAGPPVISDPRWVRRPRDLARYYPPQAIEMNIQGEVILDCAVEVTGTLRCQVASETPPRWGFGQAAVRMARDHRMAPAMRVGGRWRAIIACACRSNSISPGTAIFPILASIATHMPR